MVLSQLMCAYMCLDHRNNNNNYNNNKTFTRKYFNTSSKIYKRGKILNIDSYNCNNINNNYINSGCFKRK